MSVQRLREKTWASSPRRPGYNLYVCGNGGAKPVHAKLLATDCSVEECLKYVDRFLMYYISTAKHLQRTAPWLAELEGGIDYLKKVVIEDSLGIAADLEQMMERNRANEKCEWKAVAYDEELRQKFQQFANTKETHDSEQIEYIDMRGQRHPNLYSPPDITGPALYRKEDSHSSDWEWIFAGPGQRLPQKWWAQCGSMACRNWQCSTFQVQNQRNSGWRRRIYAPTSRLGLFRAALWECSPTGH